MVLLQLEGFAGLGDDLRQELHGDDLEVASVRRVVAQHHVVFLSD